jgi:hypothetical protein
LVDLVLMLLALAGLVLRAYGLNNVGAILFSLALAGVVRMGLVATPDHYCEREAGGRGSGEWALPKLGIASARSWE